MEFSLYRDTSLASVSENTRNAVLKALKISLEEQISDTQKSVELINSLVDYISFLEWIFLSEWQHFTEEDFKTPGLSSLLMTSNRHDEKEKREILEFFKEQYKPLYPDIFTGDWFVWPFSSDNPASLLIDAVDIIRQIRILKIFYDIDEIKKLDIKNSDWIHTFLFQSNLNYILKIIFSFAEVLWIQEELKKNINLLCKPFFSNLHNLIEKSFIDNDDEFDPEVKIKRLKVLLWSLRKIQWFNLEWILDIDLYEYFKGKKTEEFYINLINNLWIRDIKIFWDRNFKEQVLSLHFNYISDLDRIEKIIWKKVTLKDIENWWLKTIWEIRLEVHWDLVEWEKLQYIFPYFIKWKQIYISRNKEKIINLFTFISGITGSWIWEDNFKKIINEIEKILWFRINFDSFENEKFAIFLASFINEQAIWKMHWDWKQEEFKDKKRFEKFFAKFPQFVWKNEKWEKYSRNWNMRHFSKEKTFIWILLDNNIVDFINLFLDEFEDTSDLFSDINFNDFYTYPWKKFKKNTIILIKFVKKYNLFEIKLSDITPSFITKMHSFFDDLSTNMPSFPLDFFDEEITLKSFEDPLLKSLVLEKSKMFENLKTICGLYNSPIKLSSFRKIFFEFKLDLDSFIIFFRQSNNKQKIEFIFDVYERWFWEKILLKDLIYILLNSREKLNDIWEVLLFLDLKLDFLSKIFYENLEKIMKFYRDFFKKEEWWNLQFNSDKGNLLSLICNVDLDDLQKFLETFSWVTLWKIVRFYKAGWFKYDYEHRPVLKFLIQYSLDKNDYKYLENNKKVLNLQTIQAYSFIWNTNLNKLKILLNKTWWFLTEIFVQKFIIWNCSEGELDGMIEDYEKFRNILLSGWTLDWIEDKYWLVNVVIKDVYPERGYSADVDDYKDETTHLERYKFDKNWYTLYLTWWTSYRLKNQEKLDEKITWVYKSLFEVLKQICFSKETLIEYLEKKAQENDIKLETSSLESQILEYYKKLEIKLHGKWEKLKFQDLDILIAFWLVWEFDKFKTSYNSNENKDFSNIFAFLIEFWDKFKESLKSLVSRISPENKQKIAHFWSVEKSKRNKQIENAIERIFNIFSKIPENSRNIWRLKQLVSNNLKAFFDENSLENFLDALGKFNIDNLWNLERFKERFLQIIETYASLDFGFLGLLWVKYYSFLEKEIAKFEKVVSWEKTWQERVLNCYFMKTKESSRARWVAWNCAWTHKEMWDNKNYFELVLFDRDLKQCVWVVELLVMDDKRWKYLLYGPTPRETYLEKVDGEEIYFVITDIIINFAQNNWFDWILTNTDSWMMWNATWKFRETFQKSVRKDRRISLNNEYVLFWLYKFKDNLEMVWEKTK